MPIAPGLGQIVAVLTRSGEVRARIATAEEAARFEVQATARPDLYARVYVATVFRVTEMPEPDGIEG